MSDALRAYLEHPVSQRRRRPRPAGAGAGRGAARHGVARVRRARPRRRRLRGARRGLPAAPLPDPGRHLAGAGLRRRHAPRQDRGSRRLQPRPAAGAAGIAAAHLQRRRRRPAAAAHRRHPRRLRIAGARVHRAQRAARRAGVDGRLLRQGPEQLGSRRPPSPRVGGRRTAPPATRTPGARSWAASRRRRPATRIASSS